MLDSIKTYSKVKFLFLILVFLIAANLSIVLDIPVLRQVFSFIFLTFVPGFIILNIFKLNNLGLTEKTILSVGSAYSLTCFLDFWSICSIPFLAITNL